MNDPELRRSIVAVAQTMHREGLVVGSAGNVSARAQADGGMHITPTQSDYAAMAPDDVVTVTFDGDPLEGEGLPSAESLLHGAIYRAHPDIGAVVHAHPRFASVLAVRHEPIPAIVDEQVINLGGAVSVSAYAPAGSEDLARNALAALGSRRAVLLANHGTVALGGDPGQALEVTRLVERLAEIWYFASARPGAVSLPTEIVQAETALYEMMRRAEAD